MMMASLNSRPSCDLIYILKKNTSPLKFSNFLPQQHRITSLTHEFRYFTSYMFFVCFLSEVEKLNFCCHFYFDLILSNNDLTEDQSCLGKSSCKNRCCNVDNVQFDWTFCIRGIPVLLN